jgi:hypothetical protein
VEGQVRRLLCLVGFPSLTLVGRLPYRLSGEEVTAMTLVETVRGIFQGTC